MLSALCALSELYIYTRDCNSLNLRFVLVPPAGTSSFGCLSGNTGHKVWLFPLPRVLFCGSTPLHSQPQSWRRLLRSCSSVVFSGFQTWLSAFLAQGLLRGKDGKIPSPYPALVTTGCWKLLIWEKRVRSSMSDLWLSPSYCSAHLPVWLWESCLTSLSHSFLFCQRGDNTCLTELLGAWMRSCL